MAIPPIGSVSAANEAPPTQQNTIDQSDFIKLFLSQLQFQDPLEPVDNREFLAQMAQFSALEQARQTSANTQNLLLTEFSSQALSLVGKEVVVEGQSRTGHVTAVSFTKDGPVLDVTLGSLLLQKKLGEITRVLEGTTNSPFPNPSPIPSPSPFPNPNQ